ncbi:MAG: GAF domain-containing protein [Gammaproteobacteria bacterium]|nr:GAF domain-containing protein [Gammaproteobacteria bacterium]
MTKNKLSLLLKQAEALLADESDQIANAANLSSLIFHNVPRLNWAGFYFHRQGQLVLGPFSGQLACTRIPLGSGVCGTAFAKEQTLVVDDVHQFDGHIACDSASQSEIVVPFSTNLLDGVLDIDSPVKSRFGPDEKDFFERLVVIYCKASE